MGDQIAIRWGTAEDLSKSWKIPVSTIHQWATAEDGIPSVRVGRHRRFPMNECDEWLSRRREGLAGEKPGDRPVEAAASGDPREPANKGRASIGTTARRSRKRADAR